MCACKTSIYKELQVCLAKFQLFCWNLIGILSLRLKNYIYFMLNWLKIGWKFFLKIILKHSKWTIFSSLTCSKFLIAWKSFITLSCNCVTIVCDENKSFTYDVRKLSELRRKSKDQFSQCSKRYPTQMDRWCLFFLWYCYIIFSTVSFFIWPFLLTHEIIWKICAKCILNFS